MFKLSVKPSVEKDARRIPKEHLQRIACEIKTLKFNPLPPGAKKIKKGKEIHYRIRQGDYRVGYQLDVAEKITEIIYIKRRSKTTYK